MSLYMGDWTRGYGPFAEELSLVFAGFNRNKRSIVLDVTKPEGKQILLRLLKDTDVLVHNFRPGVAEKLGLDYASLKDENPRLIHARSSGWGDEGPYVLERERSGVGQEVSTDLLSAAVHAGVWHSGETLNSDIAESREHDLASTDSSIPRAWRTGNGFMEISAVFSPDALRDISVAMGLHDLAQDARSDTARNRAANKGELVKILQERFLEKTTEEWLDTLEKQGILCAEIKAFGEALSDPQTLANNMVVEIDRPGIGPLRLLGTPVRLSRTPASVRSAPPLFGRADRAGVE